MITPDMDETVRFYAGVLGMRLAATTMAGPMRHYFFEIGDENTIAFFEVKGAETFAKPAGAPSDRPIQFDHLSFNVPDEHALEMLRKRLLSAGSEVTPVVDHGFIRSDLLHRPARHRARGVVVGRRRHRALDRPHRRVALRGPRPGPRRSASSPPARCSRCPAPGSSDRSGRSRPARPGSASLDNVFVFDAWPEVDARWTRSGSAGWASALDGPGGGYDKIHRLAFDEAVEQGLLNRPYEFVLHAENGLPHGSAKNAIDGFKYLVDEGCLAVAGAYSSDNAMVVGPYANELQVPLLSWCGTERFWGDYCFRLGNGDCGGDAALVVGWLKRQGYERVAVLSEVSPNGEEYFRYFRQECRRRGISIAAVETVSQTPPDLAANLEALRAVGARTRSPTWVTACSPRRERCARPSIAWRGTRRASWAPRSCSI